MKLGCCSAENDNDNGNGNGNGNGVGRCSLPLGINRSSG